MQVAPSLCFNPTLSCIIVPHTYWWYGDDNETSIYKTSILIAAQLWFLPLSKSNLNHTRTTIKKAWWKKQRCPNTDVFFSPGWTMMNSHKSKPNAHKLRKFHTNPQSSSWTFSRQLNHIQLSNTKSNSRISVTLHRNSSPMSRSCAVCLWCAAKLCGEVCWGWRPPEKRNHLTWV